MGCLIIILAIILMHMTVKYPTLILFIAIGGGMMEIAKIYIEAKERKYGNIEDVNEIIEHDEIEKGDE